MTTKKKTAARRASIKPALCCIADTRIVYHEGLYQAGLDYFRGVETVTGTFRAAAKAALAQFVDKARTNETDLARKAMENSLQFSYLVSRSKLLPTVTEDAARLAKVLELNQLKNWTKDCKGDDSFRSQALQLFWDSWRTEKKAVLKILGLETMETRGGARDNAGRKGTKDGNASKLVTGDKGAASTAPSATPPAPASTAPSATPPAPASTVQDMITRASLASYFERTHEDMARKIGQCAKENPHCAANVLAALKDKEVTEALTRIDQEMNRLVNLLRK